MSRTRKPAPRAVESYTHTLPTQVPPEGFDPRPGYYYVGYMEGARPRFALGPFAAHQRAAELVRCVHDFCIEHDPKHHFDAFGVLRLPDDFPLTDLPRPPINQLKPEWAPTADDQAALAEFRAA